MRRSKISFWALSASFLAGITMISNGLASLPPAYEKPSTTILNSDLSTSKMVKPHKILDSETIATNLAPKQNPNKQDYVVKSGDTLSTILQRYNIDNLEIALAADQINDVYKLNQIRPGMELKIRLSDDKDKIGFKHLKSLKFKPSVTETVDIESDNNGGFTAKRSEIPMVKVLVRASGEIEGSLYQSALKAGVTQSVMAQMISALSYVVDFQRDIQPGNKFSVLFEGYTNQEGEFVKSNRPLYVNLKLRKQNIEIYVVEKPDGTLGYYHADGASVKKALLRTPVDGVRMTSGFGMRRHPILGFNKMHKGVDFGAPTGTPIYAAGDGVIEKMGYFGAYGNYVRLRHNGTYSTAYAHISRYERGLKQGMRVKQGQKIAYVGTTGRSTGPHLHYEVLERGVQINPTSAKLPIADKLTGTGMANFKTEKKRIDTALANAPTQDELKEVVKAQAKADKAKAKADSKKQQDSAQAEKK